MENHEKVEEVEDPGDPYPTHRDDFVWKNSTQWLRAKVKTNNKGLFKVKNVRYSMMTVKDCGVFMMISMIWLVGRKIILVGEK